MADEQDSTRTKKGELARQHILETAFQLFGAKGYEETTMRDIAAQAGYSPGLTYRYFTSKEELVILLYEGLAEELDIYTRNLPSATLVELFNTAVTRLLELMAPNREVFGALFGTALHPRSKVGVFGENTAHMRRQARDMYLTLIKGAKDAPRASQCEDLATILYGAHLALVLFWLIDQSAEARRSQQMLAFLCDILKLMQPILWFPVVSQALSRLAQIIGPLLGDERKTAQSSQREDTDDKPM